MNTRFCPTIDTGYFHIGNYFNYIVNYLYAKQNNSKFFCLYERKKLSVQDYETDFKLITRIVVPNEEHKCIQDIENWQVYIDNKYSQEYETYKKIYQHKFKTFHMVNKYFKKDMFYKLMFDIDNNVNMFIKGADLIDSDENGYEFYDALGYNYKKRYLPILSIEDGKISKSKDMKIDFENGSNMISLYMIKKYSLNAIANYIFMEVLNCDIKYDLSLYNIKDMFVNEYKEISIDIDKIEEVNKLCFEHYVGNSELLKTHPTECRDMIDLIND